MRKIEGKCFFNRAEAIGYLMHGYGVKWCMTKWSGNEVVFSLQAANGTRQRLKTPGYKTKDSRIVRVLKDDLDAFFEAPAKEREGG